MLLKIASGLGYAVAGLIAVIVFSARVVFALTGPALICFGIDQFSRPAATIAAGVFILAGFVLFTVPIRGSK